MKTEIQNKAPLVSVIMPAYNAEELIGAAMDSVLSQTVTDLELIVIEDCSKDRTRDVIDAYAQRDPRIRVLLNEQNMGVAKTRNRGIEVARGDYIAFLDSDDVWHPEKLCAQIRKMTEEDAQISYCSYAIIGPQGDKVRADYLVPERVTYEDLLTENCMQCSAMLIRAEVVRKLMFNTEYFHEDYILGLDMLRLGYRAVGCSEILLNWRYIENSRSFNKWRAAKNRWAIYRAYLKLPVGKTLRLFCGYTVAGLRKYLPKSK